MLSILQEELDLLFLGGTATITGQT